jgi:hypothetical protein
MRHCRFCVALQPYDSPMRIPQHFAQVWTQGVMQGGTTGYSRVLGTVLPDFSPSCDTPPSASSPYCMRAADSAPPHPSQNRIKWTRRGFSVVYPRGQRWPMLPRHAGRSVHAHTQWYLPAGVRPPRGAINSGWCAAADRADGRDGAAGRVLRPLARHRARRSDGPERSHRRLWPLRFSASTASTAARSRSSTLGGACRAGGSDQVQR